MKKLYMGIEVHLDKVIKTTNKPSNNESFDNENSGYQKASHDNNEPVSCNRFTTDSNFTHFSPSDVKAYNNMIGARQQMSSFCSENLKLNYQNKKDSFFSLDNTKILENKQEDKNKIKKCGKENLDMKKEVSEDNNDLAGTPNDRNMSSDSKNDSESKMVNTDLNEKILEYKKSCFGENINDVADQNISNSISKSILKAKENSFKKISNQPDSINTPNKQKLSVNFEQPKETKNSFINHNNKNISKEYNKNEKNTQHDPEITIEDNSNGKDYKKASASNITNSKCKEPYSPSTLVKTI